MNEWVLLFATSADRKKKMYKNYTREGYNYSKKGTNQFSKCNQTASAIVFISYTREGYNYSQKEQISSQNASKELLSSSLTTSGLVGSVIESCVMTGVHQRTLQTSYDFLLVFCSDLGLCGSVVRYLRQRRASKDIGFRMENVALWCHVTRTHLGRTFTTAKVCRCVP